MSVRMTSLGETMSSTSSWHPIDSSHASCGAIDGFFPIPIHANPRNLYRPQPLETRLGEIRKQVPETSEEKEVCAISLSSTERLHWKKSQHGDSYWACHHRRAGTGNSIAAQALVAVTDENTRLAWLHERWHSAEMSDSQRKPPSRSGTVTTTAVSSTATRSATRVPSRVNTNHDLERGNGHVDGQLDQINQAMKPNGLGDDGTRHHHHHLGDFNTIPRTKAFWAKFNGAGKKHVPGWVESASNTVPLKGLNLLIVFVPLSWAAHWANWHFATFALSFLAIVPLEKLSDFGGEQMALYLGTSLGDLLVITLDNVVEATLAIILLVHCELKLVQSTLIGVILLHLLLVPGTAFLTGGAQIWEQHLRPHPTQLNHSLLTFGVITLLLPVALFAALPESLATSSGGSTAAVAARLMARAGGEEEGLAIKESMIRAAENLAVTDASRGAFLKFSRGLAILLLIALTYILLDTSVLASTSIIHLGKTMLLISTPTPPRSKSAWKQRLRENNPKLGHGSALCSSPSSSLLSP
ncbi:sodium/calcium exchanger protein domain-containing protein [Rhizoctonia solani AG-1 IA]|uniref:Sodium/calcium exchanger protein domain-containing protein n=1 Tax=Thanatephorus cucumeris (strain AG1-IA) TaxID=983506 RepID=L8WYD6_THACA|nr:sodium/calcium exchanger protein domain-containing protein [Rhizoctonia solani AG-1 IA]